VGRKINEMNHGRSVEDAMAHLGLQECVPAPVRRRGDPDPDARARRSKRDFLPGLEVRLLDHQLVGVSWYAPRAPAARPLMRPLMRPAR
jgi:hypothetical protein